MNIFKAKKEKVLEEFERLVKDIEEARAANLGTEVRVWVPPWKRVDEVVEEVDEVGLRLPAQEGQSVVPAVTPQIDVVEEAVDVAETFTKEGLGVRFGLDVADPADSFLFQRELFTLFGRPVVFRVQDRSDDIYVGIALLDERFPKAQKLVHDFAKSVGFKQPDSGIIKKRVDKLFGKDRVVPVFVKKADDNLADFLPIVDDVPGVVKFSDMDHSDLVQMQEALIFNWLVENQNRGLNIIKKNSATGDLVLDSLDSIRLGGSGFTGTSIREYAEGIGRDDIDRLRLAIFDELTEMVGGATTRGELADQLLEMVPIVDEVVEPSIIEVALAPRWVEDALERDLDIGEIVKTTKRKITLRMTREQFEEALGDARHYTDTTMGFEQVQGIQASARAAIKELEKHTESFVAGPTRSEVAGALEMLAEEIRLGGAARELNAAELAQISESLRRTLADDTTDLWRQFMKAVDDEMVEVSFTDIEPFLLKLESEDGMQFAKEYAKIIYGADGLTDAQLDDFLLRLRTVRQQVEEFYEGLGVPVRKPDLGVEITAGERLARDMADQLGFDVKPVYTVRRQVDEVDEVDLPPSFWTEQPDPSLRRLGEEVSDDEVSSALEFGIWQYLTSTKGLDVIDVPVRPGGMVLPTGVDALTDFTKPQTFAEFMENDWAFRGLRERFIAGE
ncbi:MAG: hypothetical protein OXI63_25095, partial [Candidatus Poribacteria bacterium]|nr:hypothetical protein [Candidatus Poribacteria bacterium]